jgi:gamma-glutamylaminecyclotransferase
VPPLFVYGTLMAGQANAAELAGATFLGAARTAAGYTLYDLGPYPGLCAGGATAVSGELYQLSPGQLDRLDEFEEHPTVYRRTPISLDDGRAALAYLLVARPAASALPITEGDWRRRPAPR